MPRLDQRNRLHQAMLANKTPRANEVGNDVDSNVHGVGRINELGEIYQCVSKSPAP
jgi:hypothetical protein